MILSRFAKLFSVAVLVLAVYPISLWAQTPTEPTSPIPAIPGITAPSATPSPGAPSPTITLPQTQRPIDLVVTVTMSNGTSETFSREIDVMEIVQLPDGRINMVHLVLVSGGERNTHIWYNNSGISKFSYRFGTAEGKNKIRMRIVQPSAPSRDLTERVEPLSSKDFQ